MKRAIALIVTVLLSTAACRRDTPASHSAPPIQPTMKITESSTATVTTASTAAGLASPRVAPFRRMSEALNLGDASTALTLFADEAIWERGGQCPPGVCVGKQTVQRELMRDVAAHHQLTLLSADAEAAAPIVRLELRNDGTRRAGVERVIQFFAVEIRNDKISAIRVSFDMSDPVTAQFVASQAGSQR